jgi:ABC-type sugar transport system, periplasmic component
MKKRLLSSVLAMLLVIGLLAACGGKEGAAAGGSSKANTPETADNSTAGTGESSTGAEEGDTGIDFDSEPYEINMMYLVAAEGANQEKVEKELNELALKELNMTVKAIPMTFSSFNSQLPMMLAANEPLDIFVCGSTNFSTYIDSEYVVDLKDYLGELSDAMEILGDDAKAGYIGDFLIGLSQMKERAYPAGLVVRKDIFEEMGYKVEDFNVTVEDYSSFDQLTELFTKVRETYPDMMPFDGTSIMGLQTGSYIDNMGNNFGVLEDYGQTTTVTNWFESDQYKKFAEIGRDWFTNGYASSDIAVNTDSGELKMRAGNTFSYMTNVKPNTDVEKLAQTTFEVEIIPVSEVMKNTNAVNAILFSVAKASKDPKKAAQFMNWTYKSAEFNNLINWGILDEDWVITDDNMAAYPEGIDASNVGYHNDFGFAYPNQFAGYPWVGNSPTIWDDYKVYNAEMMVSKAFGFTFDSRVIAAEEAQLNSVYDQYYKDIAFGAVDVETGIKEFNDALYAAGLQKVMDEKQKQLDEWLAKQ